MIILQLFTEATTFSVCSDLRPKYYHEVHGFIFVVDSSDLQRLDETAEVFAEIVANDKVQVSFLTR